MYTVQLRDKITYQQQSWEYVYMTSINVVDPCLNTMLNSTYTKINNFEYQVTKNLQRNSFFAISDTFAYKLKNLYPNACGPVDYVIKNKENGAIPSWTYVINGENDDTKYIATQTNNTQFIGNYTMVLTASLKNYPTKKISFDFWLNVTEFKNQTLDYI